jgi:hypothetical protein
MPTELDRIDLYEYYNEDSLRKSILTWLNNLISLSQK